MDLRLGISSLVGEQARKTETKGGVGWGQTNNETTRQRDKETTRQQDNETSRQRAGKQANTQTGLGGRVYGEAILR